MLRLPPPVSMRGLDIGGRTRTVPAPVLASWVGVLRVVRVWLASAAKRSLL